MIFDKKYLNKGWWQVANSVLPFIAESIQAIWILDWFVYTTGHDNALCEQRLHVWTNIQDSGFQNMIFFYVCTFWIIFCLSPDALQDVKTIAMTDDRNTRRLRHANIASVSLSNYPTLPPVELDAVPAVANNALGYNCKVTSWCFSIWFIATQKISISKIYTVLRLW